MCGIFTILSKSQNLNSPRFTRVLELIKHRGPDSFDTLTVDLQNGYFLHMASSVLHLRGKALVPQPFCCMYGNVLQWNGEIFGGLEVKENESDTEVLAAELSKCRNERAICDVLQSIEGPWAFIYYQPFTRMLWFGRDYFGRRSLLFQKIDDGLILSSVGNKPVSKTQLWNQIHADGVYVIDMRKITENNFFVKCHLWRSITRPDQGKLQSMKHYDPNYKNYLLELLIWTSSDTGLLQTSMKEFSCHYGVKFPLVSTTDLSDFRIFSEILKDQKFSDTVNQLLQILRQAVCRRVTRVPKASGTKSSVSILFSGGIDCTVIALLADEFVARDEPILLLNVAFETPSNNGSFDVPDRITGRCAVNELKSLRPNRIWEFIEIDVDLQELKKMRQEVISELTYPLATVLDDSIGCALWFAARGLPGSHTKVVLSGLGADEQLGGYSRHRAAFESSCWEGVKKEIAMEIERLSVRNLGRDDRVITDHGKEARFPYLDERVVSFFNETPLLYKSNFLLKRGTGEKFLLRAAGYKVGLREIALLPKRAIQFGSRIAKAESRKEKASDICERLL